MIYIRLFLYNLFVTQDLPDDYYYLQKGKSTDLHCCQHSCTFKTESGYRKHLEICSSLFGKRYVCTAVENERMCGKDHSSASELFYHTYFKHKLLLCDKCGNEYHSYAELKNHEHSHQNTMHCKKKLCDFRVKIFKFIF